MLKGVGFVIKVSALAAKTRTSASLVEMGVIGMSSIVFVETFLAGISTF